MLQVFLLFSASEVFLPNGRTHEEIFKVIVFFFIKLIHRSGRYYITYCLVVDRTFSKNSAACNISVSVTVVVRCCRYAGFESRSRRRQQLWSAATLRRLPRGQRPSRSSWTQWSRGDANSIRPLDATADSCSVCTITTRRRPPPAFTTITITTTSRAVR